MVGPRLRWCLGVAVRGREAKSVAHPIVQGAERLPSGVLMRARRILALGSLAIAAIAFATGMRSSGKPDSERAYFHELARLNAVDKPRALAFARQGDRWY